MPSGSGLRVGITDYAQDALGDVVFVALPAMNASVEQGGPLGEVESTKSVSDVYAPVAGTVVEVNDALGEFPGHLNDDPYGKGWICVVAPADEAAFDALLDAEAYRELIAG